MPFLIYVHGFNSSEKSFKSQQVKQRMEALGLGEHFACPRLPWQPAKAIAELSDFIEQRLAEGHEVALVGSSLGGFYATFLGERFQLPVVLVNPAVEAPKLLRHYLGPQHNPYTDEHYVLAERHMGELEAIDIAAPETSRTWLMVQEQDEVLDYRAALRRYPTPAKLTHEQGGDHSFVNFDRFIDEILRFSGFSV